MAWVCARILLRTRLFECFHCAAFILLHAATCLCLILGFVSLAFLARLAASMHRVGSPTPYLQIEFVRCFFFFLMPFFDLLSFFLAECGEIRG